MVEWWEICIKGRMDRGIDGLVNLKMNDLTAGYIQGNVDLKVK